jgi:hypothetical protein
MIDNLESYIQSQTADDIVASPFNFNEYSPFVVVSFLRKVDREEIPSHVLAQLKHELEGTKVVVKDSFWRRLWQLIMRKRND